MSRRFKHWAYLNEEGKKLYGKIFPKGEIPVVSMIPGLQKLEGINDPQMVYMIFLDELTKEQFDKIVQMFHEIARVPKETIVREIKKMGLPLRDKYVSGAGTNHLGLFI